MPGAVKYYILVSASPGVPTTNTVLALTGTWTPNIITGFTITAGGTGGSNGTFTDGTLTGGGGTGCTFAYTIAGGIVTNMAVLTSGNSYTTTPTLVMPSAGALTGFAATANISAKTIGGGTNLEADDTGQAINGTLTVPTRNNTADITVDGQVILHNGLTAGNVLASGVIFTATADAVSNTKNTTVTLLGTGVGTKTLPINFLIAGRTIRIRIKGTMTSTITTACTLTFLVKLGSVTICTSAAVAPSTAVTSLAFEGECELTCRTVGSSGTVYGQGVCRFYNSATVMNSWGMPATAVATIDTTATQVVDFQCTQSNTTNAQTLTITSGTIEVLN